VRSCRGARARPVAAKPVVFIEEWPYGTEPTFLPSGEFGCSTDGVCNESEQKGRVPPVPVRILPARDSRGSCFGEKSGDKRRPQHMPTAPAEHDFNGFSGVEDITSSRSRNRSGWWGRSQVRALPYIIRCKDIELHLARPWVRGG
jgi:hypothetical protein